MSIYAITGEDRISTWFRAEDKQYFVLVSIIVAIYDLIPFLLQTNRTG